MEILTIDQMRAHLRCDDTDEETMIRLGNKAEQIVQELAQATFDEIRAKHKCMPLNFVFLSLMVAGVIHSCDGLGVPLCDRRLPYTTDSLLKPLCGDDVAERIENFDVTKLTLNP